ncbi:MAG TPA: efflux RND transporter periplasmic adaptor subunit [Syntrophales bacterium]|nr:efflux RND transporter periplasmic adaptor subunit [Syntrophales bacterium]
MDNRTKRTIAAGVFAAALLLGGCGQPNAGPRPGPPEVAVMTIRPQQVVIATELTGRTSAHLVSDVRPQVGGIIQKRLFTEGADVKAGQPLYQIDPATYQAALNNARAGLARAEASLSAIRLKADRLRDLWADKAVSRQDVDDAEAALKQTEADIQFWKATVETAQINLKYTTVTAPISGRIGRSSVTPGALVTAHQPAALAVIQQLDPMYVDVPQSTADLLRLRKNLAEGKLQRDGTLRNKVRLILEDGTPYPQAGSLQFLDVTVDPSTGSVVLRIVFPNPQGVLLPGMFVRAVVQEGFDKKAILMPQQAISQDPKGNPLAYTVDARGIVQKRGLVLDRAIGNTWLVSSGLAAGDRLIVEGGLKVKPGDAVKVVPFEGGDRGPNATPAAKTP